MKTTDHVNGPGARGPDKRGRKGIALILVLGMLAILMMAGVAFSISMRTERLGAGSFRFGVSSRNLVWAGLAHAMDDINTTIATNGHVYPNWMVLPSGGIGSVRIAFGQDSLWELPQSADSLVKATDAHWVVGGNAGGAGSGTVEGRFAYLIVNLSGFLDANYVGGSNRWAGASPKEIVISNLAEIANAADFVKNRETEDKRYETIRELYMLQGDPDATGVGTWGLKQQQRPIDLIAYSRFPAGFLAGSNIVNDTISIGGSVTDLENDGPNIIAKLKVAGIPAGEAAFVFSNLLDYVDTDNEPRNLASACTESVPMINEVMVTGAVWTVGGQICAAVMVDTEWFYPFIKASGDNFQLRAQISATLSNTTTGAGTTAAVNPGPQASGYNSGVGVQKCGVVITPPMPPGPAILLSVLGATGHVAQITVSYKGEILNSAGKTVDAVPAPLSAPALKIVTSGTMAPPPGTFSGFCASKECVDPRFNWNAGNPAVWIDPSKLPGGTVHTIGKTNCSTTAVLANYHTPGTYGDWDTAMYVSDRGSLVSAGELGNLLRGGTAPTYYWRTIKLYDHSIPAGPTTQRDDVLRCFTVYPTNAVRRGLVNLNTTNVNVLVATFTGEPVGYAESDKKLTPADAAALANMFVTNRAAGYVCTNVSDIAGFNWRGAYPNLTEVERESIIAYSYQLLGTRENLFAILIASGPFAPGLGLVSQHGEGTGDWLGYQRALAIVWRDPFPNKYGKNPCFVQMFKWLSGGD